MSGYDYRQEIRDLDLPGLKSPDIKDKWQRLSDKLDILVKSVLADLSGRANDEGEKFPEYPGSKSAKHAHFDVKRKICSSVAVASAFLILQMRRGLLCAILCDYYWYFIAVAWAA